MQKKLWVGGGLTAALLVVALAPDVEIRGLDVELRGLALENAPTAIQGLRAEGDLKTGEIVLGA